jgi:hypothetical protein
MAQPHNPEDRISVFLTSMKAWKFMQNDLLGGCPKLIIINQASIK